MSASLPEADALLAALERQMRGRLAPDAALVGIYTGGVWLAERLHAALGLAEPLGTIAVTLHRDDFRRTACTARRRRDARSRSPSRAATWCWSTTCCTPGARCARR